MCNTACIEFGEKFLNKMTVQGKRILEVGSQDVNGSLRQAALKWSPNDYVGCDIIQGKGVDVVCNVYNLIQKFGYDSFDIVMSTEMLEHVENWRSAITNLKGVLKPNGLLIITTRSKGFPKHDYPSDYWRYEIEDMRNIFSDFELVDLIRDRMMEGVFVCARKPDIYKVNDLNSINLYSINEKPEFDLKNLDQLALLHGTDKSSAHHSFTKAYSTQFSLIADRIKAVLEIGVDKGASVKTWADYFPNALIYGIDIIDNCKHFETERIKIFIGRQEDETFLSSVVQQTGPLDLIIDDGCHAMEAQIKSFITLFPHLKSGGTYVIEDLHTSYVQDFMVNAYSTTIEFLKYLIDEINKWGAYYPKQPVRQSDQRWIKIESLTFNKGLCFIKKN